MRTAVPMVRHGPPRSGVTSETERRRWIVGTVLLPPHPRVYARLPRASRPSLGPRRPRCRLPLPEPQGTNRNGNCVGQVSSASTHNGATIREEARSGARNEIVRNYRELDADTEPCFAGDPVG